MTQTRFFPACASLLLVLMTMMFPSRALHAQPAPAAIATPVRVDATADDDFADLAPFGAAIGAARIVALDEQTHGGREEFVLKARLVRYLHERLGFDVLVLESGFFDVGRLHQAMQAGASVDERAPGNVFFMYSKSDEGRRLLQYVDVTQASARPLELVGMDSQHSGLLSQLELVSSLAGFLRSQGSGLPASPGWDGFASTVATMLTLSRQAPPAAQLAAFDETSARVARELAGAGEDHGLAVVVGTAPWWGRVVASLQSQARALWIDGRAHPRDQAMGDNVIWIAERMAPGRRLIVWGHAVHLLHEVPDAQSPPFAGTVVRRHFGANYHVAHLTGLGGRYLDYTSMKPRDVPVAPVGSLEARLGERQGDALYLPPPASVSGDQPSAHFFDYRPLGLRGGRGVNWESTFFIRTLTPVTMVR